MCLQRVTQPFLRSPASQWQPLSTNGEDLQQWSTFPGVVSSAKLLINEGTEDSSRVSQKNPAKRTAGLVSLTQGIGMAWASVEELEGNHCWQKDSLHSQFAKKKKKKGFPGLRWDCQNCGRGTSWYIWDRIFRKTSNQHDGLMAASWSNSKPDASSSFLRSCSRSSQSSDR